jgi:hypothetical protein
LTTTPVGRPNAGSWSERQPASRRRTARSAWPAKVRGGAPASRSIRSSRSTPITAATNIGSGTDRSVRISACGVKRVMGLEIEFPVRRDS